MAKKQGKVYLGYEDDCVNEKNQTLLNYTVNKIGGYPNWPPAEPVPQCPKCPLCGLHRLLVVQCYAPLENSIYSRTLYLFACINPNCWIQSESWICLRSQFQEASVGSGNTQATVLIPATECATAWCNGADEWGDNDNVDVTNGNVMNKEFQIQCDALPRVSDEDEESNSLEAETVEQALENLKMYDAHNANMSPVQGAVGALRGPLAAAELEGGDEPGLVSVDTPTAPTADLEALLHQAAELPLEMRSRLTYGPLQFAAKFVYVEEESLKSRAKCTDDRVMELLNTYKRDYEIDGDPKAGGGGGSSGAGFMDDEQYEEAIPLHGDKLFHAFLTRLKENPEQILRYSREEPPLLGAPLPADSIDPSALATCLRCGGRLICELQLLPAFADALKLLPPHIQLGHLHFLSVLVFTCTQSCWNATDTVVKETVVFQPEI